MTKDQVYPYFFPTTAVFVDDDRDFLLNFSLQLDESLAYRLFDSPKRAEDHMRAQAMHHDRRSFFKLTGPEEGGDNQPLLSLSINDIHKEVFNPERFSEVSVMIVDYSMPGITGLDLCKSINNQTVRNILLTGIADEHVAIEAFNEGVIDRYIKKSDKDVVQKINQSIEELQQLYFKDNAEIMRQTVVKQSLSFLDDQKFTQYFHDLCHQHNIIEYYLVDNPKGFLMLSENGKTSFCLVQSCGDLKVHHEIALDEKAPKELLDCLTNGQKIPLFSDTDGFYQHGATDWKNQLHSATKVDGQDTYYCAYMADAPGNFSQNTIKSYNDYLEELDFI